MAPTPLQEMIDKAYQLAYEYEQKHGCCSQCVLAAIQDVLGNIDDAIFMAAHGFAGGGGLSTRGTCGALAGGMLALGAKHGRDRPNFAKGRFIQSYKLAKQLHDQFVAEFGSPVCGDVQKKMMGRSFNMWDAEDFKAFEEAGGHRDKCPHVVGTVAKWTTEMLVKAEEAQNAK